MSATYRDSFKHWEDVEETFAAYDKLFPASSDDDAHGVPVVVVEDLQELEDEDEFMGKLEATMLKKDCGIIKVKLPKAYVDKLRSIPQYPRLNTLHVNIDREEFVKYGEQEGVYIRKHYPYIESTTHESILAPTMKDGELWARFKDDGNKKAVYAPEIEGSLFPQTFKPLNIGNFTGILERIKMVQGVIPGISQSMTYLGRAAATFPWHVEDEMLYSANYMHFGAGKLWYACGANQYDKMVTAFRSLYPEEYAHCVNAHMHKEFYVHPDILRRHHGLKMVKTVQRAGELIVTRPFAFHATAAQVVREKKLYCNCVRMKPVILNRLCIENPQVRKLRKRVGELERVVELLTHKIDLLAEFKPSQPEPKASTSGSSNKRPRVETSDEGSFDDGRADNVSNTSSAGEKRKPGRPPGRKNTVLNHNAGGLRPGAGRPVKPRCDPARSSHRDSSPGERYFDE
ncbi:hypothetical protein AAVH_27232 [Aphelenchoides avenae]|nr:hypothetical protein AAVH_27232 [Aphelenchus avenae]